MPEELPTYLEEAFLQSPELHYAKEDMLIYADREPDGIYLVRSGYVKAYSMTDAGEQYSRVTYKAGEYFPLLWALKDAKGYIAYQAQSEVVAHRLTKEEFFNVIHAHPEALWAVLDMAMIVYSIFVNRLQNLELDSAYKRIVFRLLSIADRFGQVRGDEIYIPVQFSHQDFAFTLSMARETASRQLQKLKNMGLISYHAKFITIHDLDRLRDELED